jgi:tRNA nucleotidyltransferase (CCA-adding enzyme)
MFKNYDERFYIVGGGLRDSYLGLESNDIDYVTDMTTEEFTSLFQEAELVGKDFPVYLLNNCEVALTRQERSTGNGYGNFEVTKVGVTIEEDLFRRDFTINSFCKNVATEEILDPFNGTRDLVKGIIRTVNPDAFIDDPVRILRGIRFSIRFGFDIEENTFNSMKDNAHRLQYVTKERIEKELNKCYHSDNKKPFSEFFRLLEKLDGLKYIFPELESMRYRYAGPIQYHGRKNILQHCLEVVDNVEKNNGNYRCAIAALFHDAGKLATPDEVYNNGYHHYNHENNGIPIVEKIMDDNRFSADIKELSVVACRLHMMAHYLTTMRDFKVVRFFRTIPKKYYDDFFMICNADHKFNDLQKVIKLRLDKLRAFKYDGEAINNSKNKKAEAEKQLLNYYRSLKG